MNRWWIVAAGVLLIPGCGGGGSPAPPTGPTTPTVSSIAIQGLPSGPLAAGQSAQLTANATYSDGSTRNVTASASWATSNPGVLTVSTSGLVTGVAAGEADVTATMSGVTGRAHAQVAGGDGPLFRVAVLLSAARVPSADDVSRVFARANGILLQKTGERMTQVDLTNVGRGAVSPQATAYLNAHASSPPDGVLAFGDDAMASSFGGYSFTIPLPPPNQNRFPSPTAGSDRAYIAVVDFFHMYARCGYDDAGNRIGDKSANGECRNQAGLTCVNNGRYWTCPNALTDLYADPDYFTGCSIVHEFMHPFGSEGNLDHYGTAQCTARTGMSAADAQNLTLFQQSCGMCPDLYPKFRHR